MSTPASRMPEAFGDTARFPSGGSLSIGRSPDPFVGKTPQFAAVRLRMGTPLVKIVTTSEEGRMEAFAAGTLAGAGSFRCQECGFAVALHELDEVPGCPQCGGEK